MFETKARVRDRYSDNQIEMYMDEAPGFVAKYAMDLIERWGMVAGHPDGEDSAGRAKLRTMTPEELVTRAYDIAELAFAEAKSRKLTYVLPEIKKPSEKAA